MEKQALLNTYINNVTMPETIAAIEKMIADGKKSILEASRLPEPYLHCQLLA